MPPMRSAIQAGYLSTITLGAGEVKRRLVKWPGRANSLEQWAVIWRIMGTLQYNASCEYKTILNHLGPIQAKPNQTILDQSSSMCTKT